MTEEKMFARNFKFLKNLSTDVEIFVRLANSFKQQEHIDKIQDYILSNKNTVLKKREYGFESRNANVMFKNRVINAISFQLKVPKANFNKTIKFLCENYKFKKIIELTRIYKKQPKLDSFEILYGLKVGIVQQLNETEKQKSNIAGMLKNLKAKINLKAIDIKLKQEANKQTPNKRQISKF